MGIAYKILDQKNEEWSAEEYEEHRALFRGGRALLKRPVLERLLRQGANEPPERYESRKKFAYYVNYCAGILEQFVAYLYSEEPKTTAEPETKGDEPFYDAFVKNCDRQGSDFNIFMGNAFREAQQTRRCWIQAELPSRVDKNGNEIIAANRQEEDAAGLRDAYLICWKAEDVISWEYDAKGELLWVITRQVERLRADYRTARGYQTITWTVWNREGWERYVWTQTEDNQPLPKDDDVIALAKAGSHSFGQVPFVEFELPEGLYTMGQLASPITENFNARCGLSWNMYCSLHATPVYKGKLQLPKNLGGGYGVRIDREDELSFLEPTGASHSTALSLIQDLKDELYRVIHQMAMSASNSAGSMLRSGESKKEDKTSTEIVLILFSQVEARIREQVMNLVSRGRGDPVQWSVAPVDNFSIDSALDVVQEVLTASALMIPSKTLTRLMHKRVAHAIVPEMEEEDRKQVDKEIDENTVEPGARPEMLMPPGGMPGAGGSSGASGGAGGAGGRTLAGAPVKNPNALANVNKGMAARRPAVQPRRSW